MLPTCLRPLSLTTFTMILVANVAWAQSLLPEEYTYDANGNLVSDANKDITGIHYNTLNLPDTITYADGRKIIYLYTATGQKIRQQVIRADGTLQTKRDYTGTLLYENNQLQQVQHDEGRVVMTGAQPEYHYHLKDHLGNVRMTVTSWNDPIEYLATMESEKAKDEGAYFSDLPVRSPYPLANHTPGGNEVISLPPGSENIASLDLAVSSGDIIYLEAYAYYENGVASDPSPGNGGGEESLRQGTAALVSTALSAVLSGGLAAAEGVTQAVSGHATGALAIAPAANETLPAAYLNYEVFDKNYTLVDGGFKKVTSQGAYNKELLALGPIHVTQPGYVRVYLNNRSAKLAVYFDDLKVTHVRGPVVQEDSYDPFGMAIAGQHTEQYAAVANRHLYNGKELQNDHDLNWHDYGARMYDAALGRWNAIDPLSEKYASWSPYQYVMNNPMKFVDPDGRYIVIYYEENGQSKLYIFDGTMRNVPDNAFVRQFLEAYNYNIANGGGDNLRELATNKNKTVYLEQGVYPWYNLITNVIYWNPGVAFVTNDGVTLSPATALEHEAAHANGAADNMEEHIRRHRTPDPVYGNAEEKRVVEGAEQKTAAANGETKKGQVTRRCHGCGGRFILTHGPTSTKEIKISDLEQPEGCIFPGPYKTILTER